MKFTKTLIKGKFVKRYKRFFADIKVNKDIITAHCPNTGSMMGLLDKNNDAWISYYDRDISLYWYILMDYGCRIDASTLIKGY